LLALGQLLYKQYDDRSSLAVQAKRNATHRFLHKPFFSARERSLGKASFPLSAYLAAPSLGVKPPPAAAVPEAGIVMDAMVSGKGTRFSCHWSFQNQAGVMLAESGDIDAGRPIL